MEPIVYSVVLTHYCIITDKPTAINDVSNYGFYLQVLSIIDFIFVYLYTHKGNKCIHNRKQKIISLARS